VASRTNKPITVALVNDYDVVIVGVANMFDQYRDRVVVAELDSNEPVEDAVDIVLYDNFAQPESDHDEIAVLVANPRASRVVVYTWNFHPDLILSAQQQGAHGYLSKTLPARELVAALEAVHAGDTVISNVPPRARSAVGLDWPGRGEGRSDRESEILALITQGQSNAEVAALTYLSPNTVKSYIRTIYRKIEVSSRTQAVLQSDPGCSMGRETRLHSRPSPHRTLARWPLSAVATSTRTPTAASILHTRSRRKRGHHHQSRHRERAPFDRSGAWRLLRTDAAAPHHPRPDGVRHVGDA